MDLLQAADWTFPVPIRYGPGRIEEIAALCRHAGLRHPLIVTDRGSRTLPFIDRIGRRLTGEGVSNDVFAGFSPNPSDVEAAAAKQAYEQGRHDAVIAVGGGSAMDGGKATSLLAGRDTPLWDFDYDRAPKDIRGFAPLICVPTTAGTGAETESTAMLTDTARGIKGCVWHPRHRPLAAILDPELTLGLPRNLTAWTGCDALVHAVEAYCVDDWHPLCDGAALQALRLIGRALRTAVAQPENLEARGAMLVGSCLAGVSFLKGLGMVHAISHMVGAACDTHHGLTNAVVLPAVLRFNEPAIADRIPEMSAALGLPGRGFAGFHDGICVLLNQLEIPTCLADLGVGAELTAEIARKASGDPAAMTNPRKASLGDIESLVREAVTGAR